MKILLAEDETDLANAIKALLIHSGYSVDLAEDGPARTDLKRFVRSEPPEIQRR